MHPWDKKSSATAGLCAGKENARAAFLPRRARMNSREG